MESITSLFQAVLITFAIGDGGSNSVVNQVQYQSVEECQDVLVRIQANPELPNYHYECQWN